MAFHKVATISDIEEGTGSIFQINCRTFAIYKIDGKYLAMDDVCNHKGHSICSGALEGEIISCSGHGWKYNITSGENLTRPGLDLEVYELKIEGEDILIDIFD